MAENRFAPGALAPEAADEPTFLPATRDPADDDADDGGGCPALGSEAEADAYWAGVADGIRTVGGPVPPRLAARAAKEQLLDDQILSQRGRGTMRSMVEGPAAQPAESVSAPYGRGPSTIAFGDGPPPPAELGEDQDALDFDPVALRARSDGWTPHRQREFVEALADTGIVRAACARVGISETSVNRLRRRADARAFDRACDAALRIGARRIVSIAYERAIEGTIKRHYFHGELKAEERVYDNRLLVALLNRLPDPADPDPAADAVAANWEPWMEAIEQGRDAPEPPPPPPAPDPEPFEARAWEDEGEWLTDAPPPPDFDGDEDGSFGERCYQRTLTEEEEQWWLDGGIDEADEEDGFVGSFFFLGRDTFLPMGYALSATSGPSAPLRDEAADDAGAKPGSGEAPDDPA